VIEVQIILLFFSGVGAIIFADDPVEVFRVLTERVLEGVICLGGVMFLDSFLEVYSATHVKLLVG
jgi:hypothetical protein